MGYYKILRRVPVLLRRSLSVIYFIYGHVRMLIPNFLKFIPSSP